MAKLVVNDNCVGCGACAATYPETFAIDDEGRSTVINNEEQNEETLNEMASICPFGAIEVKEETSND